MNQTSFGVFSRMKNERTYDAIVPTPVSVTDIALGEVLSAVIHGVLSSTSFRPGDGGARTDLVPPASCFAIPGSVLIGYALRGRRSRGHEPICADFSDFQLIQLVMLPMYLFATTFLPALEPTPGPLRPLIEALPAVPEHPARARAGPWGTFTLSSLVPVRLSDRVRHARALDRHPADDPHAPELSAAIVAPAPPECEPRGSLKRADARSRRNRSGSRCRGGGVARATRRRDGAAAGGARRDRTARIRRVARLGPLRAPAARRDGPALGLSPRADRAVAGARARGGPVLVRGSVGRGEAAGLFPRALRRGAGRSRRRSFRPLREKRQDHRAGERRT